jgi:NAD(P)-dependent dehydrogenase (short-subunit alcohol dehydrogenase family)
MEWFQKGHVAIVTGGSRGLGKALARELLVRGLLVIVDGRDEVELERARRELCESGNVLAIAGDVNDPNHVHALVAAARRAGRLDLVVNNASSLGKVPLPAIATL